MSLRHIVMWKLRDPADAPRFAELLRSCASLVPGMEEFEVGVHAPGLEASCDVVLVSTFADAAALAAYQGHPHHEEVLPELARMREQRHVLDYEVAGASSARPT